MSARDEFQKIVFGHMEDEEPTDRTKRAREVPENRVGKEVPPKRMRKLFADLKEAVRKSGKVKLSAREQLNIIRFGGEQIAKLVSSIERRATLNPKMAGPADKFLRDVAQNPMHLPTKRIYSNATPQDTASAIDRIAGSKKPSSEYTDQPYHRRALARAVKDWRGGGYENPALMKKWDWETKPPGARFSARDQLNRILEFKAIDFIGKMAKRFRGLEAEAGRLPGGVSGLTGYSTPSYAVLATAVRKARNPEGYKSALQAEIDKVPFSPMKRNTNVDESGVSVFRGHKDIDPNKGSMGKGGLLYGTPSADLAGRYSGISKMQSQTHQDSSILPGTGLMSEYKINNPNHRFFPNFGMEDLRKTGVSNPQGMFSQMPSTAKSQLKYGSASISDIDASRGVNTSDEIAKAWSGKINGRSKGGNFYETNVQPWNFTGKTSLVRKDKSPWSDGTLMEGDINANPKMPKILNSLSQIKRPQTQVYSARDELNTILFSIFSTSTAKKVFRGLAGGLERAPLIRPSGPTALGAYIGKNATGEQVSAIGDRIGGMIGSKVTMKPHSILLPRQNRFDLENSPIGKSGEKLPNIGGPVEVAAHERGHAYDPNLPERMERLRETRKGFMDAVGRGDQAAAVSAGGSMGARTMQNEYVANKRVLDQVVQHGTAGEVSAWKKNANNQMKVGYRKPMFDAAMQQKNAPQYREIGETSYLSPATNPTLSQGKQILRDNPYLRRSATALASRSGSLFLNAKGNSRAELDLILFANDPRPRDNQGQFTDANGNMINPNSIAIAYQKPQQQPQPQQGDKPKEEESKAKKLISKLNNKESNKKQTNMKQNNMSARDELNTILFGQPAPRSVKYLRHVLDGLGNEGKKEMAQASSMRAAMLMNKGEYLREIGGTGNPLRSMADTRNNMASGIRAIREHMRPRGGILYRGGVMPSSLQ